MRSCKFNKYLCLHLQKGSLVSRACCISEITRQQTSSNVRRIVMEITKSEKMRKFIKSLNISLMKTSSVSFNQLYQIVQPIYCQSKKSSRQSLFTLSFVQLLIIYNSFLLLFNQCLGASYLILGAGLVVKAPCCQITLYILHFAQFAIPIFKSNFAISSFGNFLRNVQLE